MAYEKKSPALIQFGTLAGASMASTGIPASAMSYLCVQNVRITRVGLYVTIVMNSSAPVVVQVIRSTVLNSVTTQTVIGTITIPATQAINNIVYKDITPANCVIGDHILLNVTTAATSSGSAFLVLEADYDPEVALNQTKMIASA